MYLIIPNNGFRFTNSLKIFFNPEHLAKRNSIPKQMSHKHFLRVWAHQNYRLLMLQDDASQHPHQKPNKVVQVAIIRRGNPQCNCNHQVTMEHMLIAWKMVLTESLFNKLSCTTTERDFLIHPICENKARFGEYHNLMPWLRGDQQKFKKYFRKSSASTVKLDQSWNLQNEDKLVTITNKKRLVILMLAKSTVITL